MRQASLLRWLNKPADVTQPPQELTGQAINASESRHPVGPCPPPDLDNGAELATVIEHTEGSKNRDNLSRVPANLELRGCTKEDISHLKRMNSLLLPIPYSDAFYREITQDSIVANLTLLAFWHDDVSMQGKEKGRLVGAVRARLLSPTPYSPHADTNDKPMLYLSTLVVLSPFRGHGIATTLLDVLTKRAARDYEVTTIGAHVWEANVVGLDWYQKRGFKQIRTEDGYYKRLNPKAAIVMQKSVKVLDLVDQRDASRQAG